MGFVLPFVPWWAEAIVALGALVHVAILVLSPSRRPLRPEETVYRDDPADTSASTAKPFPSLFDPPSVYLSIVVPAFKEESRYAPPLLPVACRDVHAVADVVGAGAPPCRCLGRG